MENTLYAADSLQIFWQPLLGALFLIGIVIALVPKKLRENQSGTSRLLLGTTAGLVLLFGLTWLALTVYTQTLGTQSVTGRLTEKRIVVNNTARGTSSTLHRLYYGELQAFDVPSDVYDQMVKGQCYRVSYFANVSFLTLLDADDSGLQRTAFVAAIARVPPDRCTE